tara:strand:+ start:116 stop:427 length:312 start_codon:yes stop_codon:yes gene_type:complete
MLRELDLRDMSGLPAPVASYASQRTLFFLTDEQADRGGPWGMDERVKRYFTDMQADSLAEQADNLWQQASMLFLSDDWRQLRDHYWGLVLGNEYHDLLAPLKD